MTTPNQICAERLYLTADKAKLVREGDPAAAFLYATPGTEIPGSAAERFGLVDGKLAENVPLVIPADQAAALIAEAEAAAKAAAEAAAASAPETKPIDAPETKPAAAPETKPAALPETKPAAPAETKAAAPARNPAARKGAAKTKAAAK